MRKLPSILLVACGCLVAATGERSAMAQAPNAEPNAKSGPKPQAETDAAARFDALVDAYFDGWARRHPAEATELGLHQHDGELPDWSLTAVERERQRLHQFRQRFAALQTHDGISLSLDQRIDLEMLLHSIDAERLSLERVREWQHQADFYVNVATASVYSLIERDFAPEAERLASVVAREERIPALLEQAEHNLHAVPRVNLDITRDQLDGIAGFFRDDVPRALAHALDAHDAGAASPALRDRHARAQADVLRALERYRRSLDELAPHAPERFALGARLFSEKLRDEEMIDTPLPALLAEGQAELARLQQRFREVATQIDPGKPFAEVQRAVMADYPPPAEVLATVQARLVALRRFLVDKDLVSLPSEVMPQVEETPPFMRATTLASMFTPGPFEERATKAMYNITLPDPSWPPAQTDDYMRGALSRPTIDVVSIHEAFPGHYVQFIWLPRVHSKVRKYLSVNSNAEGWAHYCEQMVLDEGWADGDPRVRLAQLQDALLRAARFVAGIRMHTGKMTVKQAAVFFHEEGYQSREVSEMEARRGTEDPTYLYYTWGKLEILRLRDDYNKKLGTAFTLKKFHDAFLALGSIPLPLARRALLH